MNWPRRLARNELLAATVFALLAAGQVRGQAEPRKGLVETRESANRAPVAATSAGELKCAVVEWKYAPPKPTLTVVCPPEEVFAPLRLYLGLSWEQPEKHLADGGETIVAVPKAPVRVRFTPTEAQVRLKVLRPGLKKPQETWVRFDEICKIGFAVEP